MALVGYARVSSVGQRLDVQVDKLQHCDKLFQEHTSGSVTTRPRLVDCLDYVREGDTLVVTRLDRLARSTWHLCQIAEVLARKGRRQPFVRNGPMGFLTNRVGVRQRANKSRKINDRAVRNCLTLCVYAICQVPDVEPLFRRSYRC